MSGPPGQQQYPPSGGGQYPPPGQNPPAQMQSYPPATGTQYPPAVGGQPLPAGQYPPPAGGQYPPPAGGQYPPPAAGQYPPPTYPQEQYPPQGYPLQPGIVPQGAGGYPPSGCVAGNPNAAYPPPYSSTPGHPGGDLDDSGPEYDIRSKQNQKAVQVRFVNKTGKKINLTWINHEGEFEKCRKIKEGKSEVLSTFEGHAFIVDGKRKSNHVINRNTVYFVKAHTGQGELVADIERGHGNGDKKSGKDSKQHKDKEGKDGKHKDKDGKKKNKDGKDKDEKKKHKEGKESQGLNVRSTNGGRQVRVKFCNRSRSAATINWVDANGVSQTVRELASKKCWFTDSSEGHYFTARQSGPNGALLDVNYGNYYTPVLDGEYNKVIITEGRRRRSGSSSDSSDSS